MSPCDHPGGAAYGLGLDALTGAASERYRLVAGDSDVATLDELTGDDFSSATDDRPKNLWLSPAAITIAVAVVASLVAARSLFGSGSPGGPGVASCARQPQNAVAHCAQRDPAPLHR